MARMTKTERIAREGLMKNLIHLNRDGWISSMIEDEIPDAWHMLEADLDVAEKKEKVTLYLDRSVARAFRAMGTGYQARINRLLATWVQMKIANEIKLDDILQKRLTAPAATTTNDETAADETPEAEAPTAEAGPRTAAAPAQDSAPEPDDETADEDTRRRARLAAVMKEIREERLAEEARAAEEQARTSISVAERVRLEDERRQKAEEDALEEGYRRRTLEREAQDRVRDAQERARDAARDRRR